MSLTAQQMYDAYSATCTLPTMPDWNSLTAESQQAITLQWENFERDIWRHTQQGAV